MLFFIFLLLIIFVVTVIHFFFWWIESWNEQHLFEKKIFLNIIIFFFQFWSIECSLVNKLLIYFIYFTLYLKPLNGSVTNK